jgi:hypothetical protein
MRRTQNRQLRLRQSKFEGKAGCGRFCRILSACRNLMPPRLGAAGKKLASELVEICNHYV